MKHKSSSAVLVLDIGTSSIKAFVFDEQFRILGGAERKLKILIRGTHHEQNPSDFVSLSRVVMAEAIRRSRLPLSRIGSIGLTNQRETTIVWDRKTGKPVYPAIVWSDTRTRARCRKLKSHEKSVRSKTGLRLDPYFSASKLAWILEHGDTAGRDLLFGTVDTWVMWNLLEGSPHITDFTNVSRTLLYNIKTLRWDDSLLQLFSVPPQLLPRVVASRHEYGVLKKSVLGRSIPLLAVCGDQQSSMAAAGLVVGTTKVTYGTGTFLMQVLGSELSMYPDFFTTLIPKNMRQPQYALEAKIPYGGRLIDTVLRDRPSLVRTLTRIARNVDTYLRRLPTRPKKLFIDGGVTRDGLMAEIQARISGIPVIGNPEFHGTARGIARLLLGAACILLVSVTPVRADTGSTILPDRRGECQAGEKPIECTSWYEKPDACNQWLNNPEYIIAEGSTGASVQHYTFCKKDPTKSTPEEKTAGIVVIGGIVALLVAGFSLFRLITLRKKGQ
ncbi:MAG: FGGY family carbohydrate kinase [Patescibacteria group bacterium]